MRKNERVAAVVAMTTLNNQYIFVNRLPQSKQPCKSNSEILEKFCEVPPNETWTIFCKKKCLPEHYAFLVLY